MEKFDIMAYNYEDIVRDWFEELKLPFLNYIHANFNISYDDIMDLYSDSWLELRRIILDGKATDNKWRALIFTIGWRNANKMSKIEKTKISFNNAETGIDGTFNHDLLELKIKENQTEYNQVSGNPDLQMVVGSEISYIPEPCCSLLKMYYYEEMSMRHIAEALNYKNDRTVISTKKRCLNKLKARVVNAAKHWGILD